MKASNALTMFVAVLQLWLLLFGVTDAIFYEDGFDHHYTYSSESDMLGLHNVKTIIKVNSCSILKHVYREHFFKK